MEFNGITFEVFPFAPLVDIKESLSWLTDIIRPADGIGSEQAISVRPIPRQGFVYNVPLKTEKEQSRFATLMHGWSKRYYGLPVWFEKEIHTAEIETDEETITFDTRYADYRDSSLAIIWKSLTEYEVVEIDTVETTVLNLASPVVNNFTGTKFIMPLRIAQMNNPARMSNPVASYGPVQVSFLVKDNVLLTGFEPEQTYNDLPVLLAGSKQLSGSLKESSIDSDSFVQDYESGDFNFISDSEFNLNLQSWGFVNETKEAMWNFRLFLHSLYGRQKCIWVPTFKKDLTQYATIGSSDTSVSIENIKLTDNMGLNDLRTHLAFKFPDNSILTREITEIAEAGEDEETVTIDSSLGVEVEVDECMISFLDCCRMASDNVEINHLVPNKHYCNLSLMAVPEPAPVDLPTGYTITASLIDYMGHGATLDPTGSIPVEEGSDLGFTVTNPGEDLIAYKIDEGEFVYLEFDNPTLYTLENIQADHTILFITTSFG